MTPRTQIGGAFEGAVLHGRNQGRNGEPGLPSRQGLGSLVLAPEGTEAAGYSQADHRPAGCGFAVVVERSDPAPSTGRAPIMAVEFKG